MMRTGSILVVSDAEFLLEILREVLQPHFSTIRTARSYRDAIHMLEHNLDTDVVLCDSVLSDGNGFQLLEHLAGPAPPSPSVVLASSQWSEVGRKRAMALGAVGCLQKPLSIQEIRSSLVNPVALQARDPRHRTLASVWVIEPTQRERLLSLGVHDISFTGALLDTAGPLAVGTSLELEIVANHDDPIRARGTVVRTQEPSWLSPGGAGVHFEWVESPARLCQLIGSHDPVSPHA
jgi:CheY-like chemotaxis protein